MNIKTIMMVLLCCVSHILTAQVDQSFFEKVESIKKNIYKISAQELCNILDISYNAIPTVTADELKELFKTHADNLLVINTLPEYYYNDCHIKGSISAPLRELVGRAASWDRSQKIIVYCALESCDAGEKGCILLRHMGFTDVSDYRGGIKEWFQLNCPTEGPAIFEYLHITDVQPGHEHRLYPSTIVCSNQLRWVNKYQGQ